MKRLLGKVGRNAIQTNPSSKNSNYLLEVLGIQSRTCSQIWDPWFEISSSKFVWETLEAITQVKKFERWMESGVKDCLKDVAKVVTRIFPVWCVIWTDSITLGVIHSCRVTTGKEACRRMGKLCEADSPHPIGLGCGATWTNRTPPNFATSTAVSYRRCRIYYLTIKRIGWGGGATWTNTPPNFATSTAVSYRWCRIYYLAINELAEVAVPPGAETPSEPCHVDDHLGCLEYIFYYSGSWSHREHVEYRTFH